MNGSKRPARRIVVTGLGLISPLGNSPDAFWDALIGGRSGVATVTSAPPGALPVSFAGEARDFTGGIDDFGPLDSDHKKAIRKGLKVMCRECQMGVASAQLALTDAGLGCGKSDPDRSGVVFGSDYMLTVPDEFTAGILACMPEERFEFAQWAPVGMTKMNPLWLLKYLPNMPASHIAIYNDLRGPNNSITQREAAANLALGEAYQVILRGHADVMVAGATGTRIHPMKAVHAALSEELVANGHDPASAARPFDLNRSGMVLGEGAGAVVLEELETARARGATIYAEVIGAGSSAAADRDLTARRDTALVNAIRATLRSAQALPEQVGHVQAHGLGTREGDIEESRAMREALGDHAQRVPVTAAKSYFGNLGAGSGAVEMIAGTLALARGRLFPILNFETPDPACRVAAVTGSGTDPGESFLNLSVTPTGQASCVLVKRYRDG
jgi:3-oxoacyl-[acyl-carrier-protein] synthase II